MRDQPRVDRSGVSTSLGQKAVVRRPAPPGLASKLQLATFDDPPSKQQNQAQIHLAI